MKPPAIRVTGLTKRYDLPETSLLGVVICGLANAGVKLRIAALISGFGTVRLTLLILVKSIRAAGCNSDSRNLLASCRA